MAAAKLNPGAKYASSAADVNRNQADFNRNQADFAQRFSCETAMVMVGISRSGVIRIVHFLAKENPWLATVINANLKKE